jgi:hypothetical protein
LAPQIEEGGPYPDLREDNGSADDHAPDDGAADVDVSGVAWGEAVE